MKGAGMAIHISEHFRENWQKRVGGEPDPAEVCGVLSRSLQVQTGGHRIEGGRYGKTLSIYWSPDDDMIIKLDPESGTVVTVMTPGVGREED